MSFEDIKAEIVPQNEEFWLNVREGDPTAAKLRLKITYVQNEVLKWDAEVQSLRLEIKNDAGILQQVRIFIEQLRTPFGFLTREVETMQKNLMRQSSIDDKADKEPDHKYYEKEKELEKAFDNYVNTFARANKIETIPWLKVTEFVVGIFLLLTMI